MNYWLRKSYIVKIQWKVVANIVMIIISAVLNCQYNEKQFWAINYSYDRIAIVGPHCDSYDRIDIL